MDIAPTRDWKRIRIAATIASVIVLSATAAVLYHNATISDTKVETKETTEAEPKVVVKVIDFENTPLPTVIEKIKKTYGVEVTNIPDNAEEYHLSLHYEGTATDLIATINEILDTKMEIK